MTGSAPANEFRLAPVADGAGVSCDGRGCFIGTVPLLQRQLHPTAGEVWMPRPLAELNAALSERYGVPIDISGKLDGLATVASALNRGDIFRAQVGTLNLKLPDPPPPSGALPFGDHMAKLAMMLHGSGMLDHGGSAAMGARRAAANSNGPVAGFVPPAPANQNDDAPVTASPSAATGRPPAIPVQAIPFPLELPWVRPFVVPRMPGEITPFPFDFPGQRRNRKPLVNPYPDKPNCVEEWTHAKLFCADQMVKGNFKPGYDGWGKNFDKCVMGQVSEECGGNPSGGNLKA